jgi:hypothetical protein
MLDLLGQDVDLIVLARYNGIPSAKTSASNGFWHGCGTVDGWGMERTL